MNASVNPDTATLRLHELDDDYTYRVNSLVEAGREDLAADLGPVYLAERDALRRSAARCDAA